MSVGAQQDCEAETGAEGGLTARARAPATEEGPAAALKHPRALGRAQAPPETTQTHSPVHPRPRQVSHSPAASAAETQAFAGDLTTRLEPREQLGRGTEGGGFIRWRYQVFR